MNHDVALAALDRIQADLDEVRKAVSRPVPNFSSLLPLKTASFEFEVTERHMRRVAEAGAGVKVGRSWFVDPALILMPRRGSRTKKARRSVSAIDPSDN